MSNSPWIQTHTGKQFHILDPNPDDIDIVDIAHALGNICRFNGHIKEFYSVAEHSVYVAQLCRKENKLAGLLHDASEAYIGDVVSPLKGVLPEYKKVEANLMEAIAKKFGFEYPLPENVHDCDLAQLHTEARQLLAVRPTWVPEFKAGDRSGMKPYCLEPERAESLFLTWFHIYTRK